MADIAAHVNFGRRLCEREIGRTHTDFRLRSEHFACKEEYGLLHIGESDAFVDVETLDLMEYAVRTG